MQSVVVLTLAYAAAAGDSPAPTFEDGFARTPAALLGNDAVLGELKLTAEQQVALAKSLASVKDQVAELQKAIGKLPAADVKAARDRLTVQTEDGVRAALKSVLTPDQSKRLGQIELQTLGYGGALTRPDVQKALNFTDAQRKKLTAATEGYERKMARLKRLAAGAEGAKTVPGTGVPLAGQAGATPVDLKREFHLAAKLVLDAEQLDQWYRLAGDPFPPKK